MTGIKIRFGQARANKARATSNCYFHEQLYPLCSFIKIPGAQALRS
jgi:hypothetical protein